MALFRYFTTNADTMLPDPRGPLAKQIPSLVHVVPTDHRFNAESVDTSHLSGHATLDLLVQRPLRTCLASAPACAALGTCMHWEIWSGN